MVGSTAAAVWGVARTTRDVDLVAAIGPEDLERVLTSLRGDDLYVQANEGERAWVPTWVATAEDVVLAKLRWRLQSRSETQWRDCVETSTGPKMFSWASSLGVTDDLDELFAFIDQIG